jgi:hypothetical protein
VEAFNGVDQSLLKEAKERQWNDGSTATVCLVGIHESLG